MPRLRCCVILEKPELNFAHDIKENSNFLY